MPDRRVVLIPGSARSASLNRRLAHDLAARLAGRSGDRVVEASVVDLGALDLPIYHGDDELEHGPPPDAVWLHDEIARADAVIFVTPEYNGGPPALLKNAIDWVTRVDRATLRDRFVGVAAAAPGGRGGATVLEALRHMFTHMRVRLFPEPLSVPHAAEAFDAQAVPRLVGDTGARADAWVERYLAALDAERV